MKVFPGQNYVVFDFTYYHILPQICIAPHNFTHYSIEFSESPSLLMQLHTLPQLSTILHTAHLATHTFFSSQICVMLCRQHCTPLLSIGDGDTDSVVRPVLPCTQFQKSRNYMSHSRQYCNKSIEVQARPHAPHYWDTPVRSEQIGICTKHLSNE